MINLILEALMLICGIAFFLWFAKNEMKQMAREEEKRRIEYTEIFVSILVRELKKYEKGENKNENNV